MAELDLALLGQGLVTSELLAEWEECTIDTVNRNLTKAGIGSVPLKRNNRLWSIQHILDVIAKRRDSFDDDDEVSDE